MNHSSRGAVHVRRATPVPWVCVTCATGNCASVASPAGNGWNGAWGSSMVRPEFAQCSVGSHRHEGSRIQHVVAPYRQGRGCTAVVLEHRARTLPRGRTRSASMPGFLPPRPPSARAVVHQEARVGGICCLGVRDTPNLVLVRRMDFAASRGVEASGRILSRRIGTALRSTRTSRSATSIRGIEGGTCVGGRIARGRRIDVPASARGSSRRASCAPRLIREPGNASANTEMR